MILHDFHLGDAFPDSGPNVPPYQQLRQQMGLSQEAAAALHVKVSTRNSLSMQPQHSAEQFAAASGRMPAPAANDSSQQRPPHAGTVAFLGGLHAAVAAADLCLSCSN